MLSLEFNDQDLAQKLVEKSLEHGVILFYFLFTKTAIRISPPLTISDEEIIKGCKIIKRILDL
jgi:acetylornithine aminotransferase